MLKRIAILLTANHTAARFTDVRDVAQTAGPSGAQSVRVQRHQCRRVFVRSRARRDAREAVTGRVGSLRLRVSTYSIILLCYRSAAIRPANQLLGTYNLDIFMRPKLIRTRARR